MSETKHLCNLFNAPVQNDLSLVKDQDVVDKALKVAYLVCGNDDKAVFFEASCQDAPETGFGRNVQAIGGLVKQEAARIAGQGKSNRASKIQRSKFGQGIRR